MNTTFIEKVTNSVEFLKNAGPKEVFRLLNDSPQFPFFFVIQTIWCCYVMKKSCKLSEKPNDSKAKRIFKLISSFFVSFVMNFASRELISIIIGSKKSPIKVNPMQIPIFVIVFALLNFSPYDIVYRIVDVLYYFIGLMQGFNQMRLFLRVIEYTKRKNLYQTGLQNYIIATGAIILEYVIECSMRRIIGTAKTNVSNRREILRTIVTCVLYVCALNADAISPFITKNHLAEVVFGAFLGIFNAAVIL